MGYSIVDSSIGTIRVVRYGFPMTWLKTTTGILPPTPTQYTILWLELIVDIMLYVALSLTLSFSATRLVKDSEAPVKEPVGTRVLFVVLAAYLTRLASAGIHELLGHGLWAWVFGAHSVRVYVSLLGFGWCSALGLSSSYVARVMFDAGGLLNTFMIGALILGFLYLTPRKGGFYGRFLLFWLGFWTTITQASYLLLGGLTGYGDPGALHSLTGVPLSFFTLLGFTLFLLVYFAVSTLFISEASVLFPECRQKPLLFEFWLTIPIQVALFTIAPEHAVSSVLFVLLFAVSMLPSFLSLLFFSFFNDLRKRRDASATKTGEAHV